MSKFCTQCGASVGVQDKFCADCGEPVGKTAKRSTKSRKPKSKAKRTPAPDLLSGIDQPRLILIGSIAAGVVLIGLLGVLFWPGETMLNQRRGGAGAAIKAG